MSFILFFRNAFSEVSSPIKYINTLVIKSELIVETPSDISSSQKVSLILKTNGVHINIIIIALKMTSLMNLLIFIFVFLFA